MQKQPMSALKKARLAFGAACALFLLSGVAAYLTAVRFVATQQWVIHSHEVQAAIADVNNGISRAGRARLAFVTTGNPDFLNEFNDAITQASQPIDHIREMTADNPIQQKFCSELESIVAKRLGLFQAAVRLRQQSPTDLQGQDSLNRQSIPLLAQTADIVQEMQAEEQARLDERIRLSRRLEISTATLLLFTFALVVTLFSIQFWLLSRELTARADAEQAAGMLSNRLIHLQDEERRRFSRELHDSLGQYLVGLKMAFASIAAEHKSDERYADCASLVDQVLRETRTLSHLLHPPGLDEAGLASAAHWYVEGFAQRSGIAVNADIQELSDRLPAPVEVALLRVLQESLTNIHKHANSERADVVLRVSPDRAVLTVRDYGVGVPRAILDRFQHHGTSGVGWAGMRGRVAELGGEFHVRSEGRGTEISVSLPLNGTQPSVAFASSFPVTEQSRVETD
ncbi:MAG TPA: CHASE3 domain-containing protein [Candidatus Acidoferrales bacterium]|nr:CHASE3 domain-containing protein [Candidatus Acidoferrales bacterium]